MQNNKEIYYTLITNLDLIKNLSLETLETSFLFGSIFMCFAQVLVLRLSIAGGVNILKIMGRFCKARDCNILQPNG